MKHLFDPGKLPYSVLKGLLDQYKTTDPQVIVGPDIGLDAAGIHFGNKILLAKTDPITFASREIGWYAIHVNANDIACMGGVPRWFLATLLLPEGQTDQGLLESIFRDIQHACKQIGVSLVGGHTEITPGLSRPIVVGCMLGETSEEELLNISHCLPGDGIILAGGIAIEATSIIARSHEQQLLQIYDKEFVARCQNFVHDPGISVLKIAVEARKAGRIRAMHDPTEGGLATALHEVADGCGCGFEVEEAQIPVWPEAKLLCDQFGLDVLGAISSGALIVIVDDGQKNNILKHLHEQKIFAAEIGHLIDDENHRLIHRNGAMETLPRFEQDEIVRIL